MSKKHKFKTLNSLEQLGGVLSFNTNESEPTGAKNSQETQPLNEHPDTHHFCSVRVKRVSAIVKNKNRY